MSRTRKNEEKYGFIYIWYDRKRKMYYIGCHWGYIDDEYVCSSNRMRDAYYRRKEDFKRRILKSNITNKKQTLLEEFYYLQMIKKEELNIKYYNKRNHNFDHWSSEEKLLLTTSERISMAMRKRYNNPDYINPLIGRSLPVETIQKIREKRAKQVFTEESINKRKRFGKDNHFHNKKHTEEMKEKNRQKSLDLWKNPEYIKKRKIAHDNYYKKKIN